MAIGTALEYPRVLALPEGAGDMSGIPLEWVEQDLYSCVALAGGAALPREIEFFNYLPGQTVSGAGAGALAATAFHTNAQGIRQLPRPGVFVVRNIRVCIPQLAFGANPALGDDTVTAAAANLDDVDDITLISQTYALHFELGQKRYVEGVPISAFPANVGIGGVIATAIANAGGVSVQQRVAVNPAGRLWDFARSRPPIIKNGESFRVRMTADWATNPTIQDDRLIFVHLGGLLGRAVQ